MEFGLRGPRGRSLWVLAVAEEQAALEEMHTGVCVCFIFISAFLSAEGRRSQRCSLPQPQGG